MAKGPGGFSVGRVSIQVVPDTSQFRKKLLAELKKEVKGIKVEIPVDLDMAKAVTQLKALDTILKRIDGRNINIGANVNSNGDLESLSKDLSKIGKSANDASSGFSSMGRTGLIVLGVVLLLAPALAVVATLIAGLPSLLFAFGGAAAAVALGFEGIKKAAKGFTPTVERLKKSLSDTFAKNLTQPFKDLNKLAPVLDKGLNAIAVSLSGIISDFVKFVTTGQGMAQVNDILQNTARFFNLLRPAFDDGFRALFLLASEASQEFDVLAATFRRFSAGFLDVVKRVTEDGTLGSALRNLNLVLDTLLESFNKFFEAGLRAMTVLGGPLSILLDGFTRLIVALMPILTAISKLAFEVFGEAFKQLVPIVEALTPGLTKLGEILGQILIAALRVLGPLLTVVAGILNEVLLKALTAIEPFIQPFLNFMTQLGMIISEFLIGAFQALSPFLDQFLKFVTDLLVAITPLMPMLIEFASQILRGLLDVLVILAPHLSELGQTLFPALLKVVSDLVPIVGEFLGVVIQILPELIEWAAIILSIAIPALQSLYAVVQEIWPSIKQIITGAMTAIQGVINLVLGLINGDWDRAWEGMKQILRGAWEAFKGATKTGIALVLDLIIGLPSRVADALIGLPGTFLQSGRAMMQGLIDGIKQKAKAVVSEALAVVQQIRNLLPFSPAKTGPFSGKGYTLYSGRALMEDWARGIEQGASAAFGAVDQVMAKTQAGMDISAAVTSEGFGDLQGQIMSAMSGWEVVIDANGITKLVNKTNQKNARR